MSIKKGACFRRTCSKLSYFYFLKKPVVFQPHKILGMCIQNLLFLASIVWKRKADAFCKFIPELNFSTWGDGVEMLEKGRTLALCGDTHKALTVLGQSSFEACVNNFPNCFYNAILTLSKSLWASQLCLLSDGLQTERILRSWWKGWPMSGPGESICWWKSCNTWTARNHSSLHITRIFFSCPRAWWVGWEYGEVVRIEHYTT